MPDDGLYLMGTDDADTLQGGSGNDALLGFAGDDLLLGNDGSDHLYGNTGHDTLNGGDGDDYYHFEYEDPTQPYDTIIDSGGTDTIRLDRGFDLAGYDEIENLLQFSDYDGRALYGNGLDNELSDGAGSNLLDGRDGNDSVFGAGGDDILVGGLGTDLMFGGPGDDRFDFRAVAESGVGEGVRDVIWDFRVNEDRIHLGRIDANAAHAGNQAFSYIGDAEFSGKAGELRWANEVLADGGSAVTIVSGDVDGDGVADFEIQLKDHLTLTAADFIL